MLSFENKERSEKVWSLFRECDTFWSSDDRMGVIDLIDYVRQKWQDLDLSETGFYSDVENAAIEYLYPGKA